MVPVEEARYVARRIPGARYLELSGGDHQPWVGDSDAVVSAIDAFVREATLTVSTGAARMPESRAGSEAVTAVVGVESRWQRLTSAERVVSMLVADGLSNPQIASRLFISRHTVEAHLKHIFLKLDVGSRVELTRIALQEGAKDP